MVFKIDNLFYVTLHLFVSNHKTDVLAKSTKIFPFCLKNSDISDASEGNRDSGIGSNGGGGGFEGSRFSSFKFDTDIELNTRDFKVVWNLKKN